MSYTPTNWKTGDVVTSAKLNKLENGVADAGGGGVLVVHDADGTLDKTWQEIHDAPIAVIVKEPDNMPQTIEYRSATVVPPEPTGGYLCVFFAVSANGEIAATRYTASSADGYPQLGQ